ncbi:MAG TPA: hypothetical protein VG889_03150 [Rhizomicrobium sp.]|nr:hypothetical protein [Rhizomicrobium sp.]
MRFRILSVAALAMALGTAATADPMLDNSYAARVHGAPPAAPSATYFIVVDKHGNKVRGSAGTSVFQATTGVYIPQFPVDVTNCIYVGSLSRALKGGGAAEPGGTMTVVRSSGFAQGVFVQTFGPRGVQRDRPFHLLVAC